MCPQCDGVQFTPNISEEYFNYRNRRNHTLWPPMPDVTYIFNISHSCNGMVTAMQYCFEIEAANLNSSEHIFTYLQLEDPGNDSKIMVTQRFEVSSFPGTRECNSSQISPTNKVFCCDHLRANFPLESFFGIIAHAGPLSLSNEDTDGYFFQVSEIRDNIFNRQNFSLQRLPLIRFIVGMLRWFSDVLAS